MTAMAELSQGEFLMRLGLRMDDEGLTTAPDPKLQELLRKLGLATEDPLALFKFNEDEYVSAEREIVEREMRLREREAELDRREADIEERERALKMEEGVYIDRDEIEKIVIGEKHNVFVRFAKALVTLFTPKTEERTSVFGRTRGLPVLIVEREQPLVRTVAKKTHWSNN